MKSGVSILRYEPVVSCLGKKADVHFNHIHFRVRSISEHRLHTHIWFVEKLSTESILLLLNVSIVGSFAVMFKATINRTLTRAAASRSTLLYPSIWTRQASRRGLATAAVDDTSLPLKGYRVLDMTRVLAGVGQYLQCLLTVFKLS